MLVKYTPAESILKPFFDDFLSSDLAIRRQADLVPRCDILERQEDYVIYAEIPGARKEDVKLEFKNGLLTISGEKKIHEKTDGEKFYCVERVCGTFGRSFRLGEEINTDKINAQYEDGVIAVFLPKTEKAQPKSIEVQIK